MIKNQLMSSLKKEGRTQLTEVEAKILLKEMGVPVVRTELAHNRKEAISMSKKIGYPIVMKIVSPDITHKSDVGGVKIGLGNKTQVEKAYAEMMSTIKSKCPQARIEGVSVQKMAPPGVEVIIGVSKDQQFGPLLMFGLGGIMVEVLKDVSFRIVPVRKKDAKIMVTELKGYPLLKGYRGQESVDISFLEDMIVNVSEFVEKNPAVKELDINPIFAYGKGAIAVDARIIIEPS
jgi:acetate---CoA ligase (ADP-forming) subunit beta